MNTSDSDQTGMLSRSEFLWLAGMSAAAAGMMPGMLGAAAEPTANPGASSASRAGQKRIAVDVLVIGGGMAGAFAAATARAKGLNVALAEKGTVGKSGCTPWANGFVVFNAANGDNKNQWIENVSRSGEYLNNRDFLDALMTDSQARYNDLVSWGAIKEGVVNHGPVLREKLLAIGVQLIERSMMTHLLMRDGRAAGAMGFSLDDEEAVVIIAKAVVMSAGSGGFKPFGYPISSLTSDGDAMAYRAGASITGKEFNDFHCTNVKYPASCWTNWSHTWGSGIARTSYGRGGGGPGGAPDLAMAFQADAGKAPVSMRGLSISGGTGGGPGGGQGGPGSGPGGRQGGPGSGPGSGPGGGPGAGPRGETGGSGPSGPGAGTGVGPGAGPGAGSGSGLGGGFGGGPGSGPGGFGGGPRGGAGGGPRGGGMGGRPGGGPLGGRPGPMGSAPGGGAEGAEGGARPERPGASGDVLGAGTGMSIHKAEGIFPADAQGGTNIPGLFAAGDGLGSMLCGAKYTGMGFSLCGSAVQGARAGQSAVAFAAQAGAPAFAEDQIASVRAALFAPRERKSGFTPAWLTQVLQNTMFPYFVLYLTQL